MTERKLPTAMSRGDRSYAEEPARIFAMAAFEDLDWSRFDTDAIIENSGLATVLEDNLEFCREWLRLNGYKIETMDC